MKARIKRRRLFHPRAEINFAHLAGCQLPSTDWAYFNENATFRFTFLLDRLTVTKDAHHSPICFCVFWPDNWSRTHLYILFLSPRPSPTNFNDFCEKWFSKMSGYRRLVSGWKWVTLRETMPRYWNLDDSRDATRVLEFWIFFFSTFEWYRWVPRDCDDLEQLISLGISRW